MGSGYVRTTTYYHILLYTSTYDYALLRTTMYYYFKTALRAAGLENPLATNTKPSRSVEAVSRVTKSAGHFVVHKHKTIEKF